MKFAHPLLFSLAMLAVSAVAATSADAQTVKAEIVTNAGPIVVELYADKAPETVDNFVKYAKDGHYDGTIFHRVISNFMIQGGGYDKDFKEKKTRAPIKNESANGLKNEPYTLAMARKGDPHSATSQFFINVNKNDFLDRANSRDGWGYAVFGKVVEGQDVVDKIKQVRTRPVGPHGDVPVEPVVIERVRILDDKK